VLNTEDPANRRVIDFFAGRDKRNEPLDEPAYYPPMDGGCPARLRPSVKGSSRRRKATSATAAAPAMYHGHGPSRSKRLWTAGGWRRYR
jgi:hypothetical protein